MTDFEKIQELLRPMRPSLVSKEICLSVRTIENVRSGKPCNIKTIKKLIEYFKKRAEWV